MLEQVRKPHRVIAYESLAGSTPRGASTYLVVEDHFAQAGRIPNVPPAPRRACKWSVAAITHHG